MTIEKYPIRHSHKTKVCQQIHPLPLLSKDQRQKIYTAIHIFHGKGYEEEGKSNPVVDITLELHTMKIQIYKSQHFQKSSV